MEPPNSSLSILEVTRVSPFSNSPHDSTPQLTLPLTFFDVMCLKFRPSKRAFFYRTESTRPYFDSVILPKLKSSLSLALSHYLPLAGRLLWNPQDPKPCISSSQNDGVQLIVAESEADFCYLSGDEQRVATELHPLVPAVLPEPPDSDDDSSPIISLQVTIFPNQGICIGVTAHHAALDGKTTTTFIKAWAHVYKQDLQREGEEAQEKEGSFSLPQDLTPSFDRTIIQDPTGLDVKILNILLPFTKEDQSKSKSLKLLPSREVGADVVRVTFELTRENIQKLREQVKKESSQESSKELHLSTFVITYAYMLTCMVRARGGDNDRPVCFGFPADYRNRLDPPVPSTYFGNCLGSVWKFDVEAGAFMKENGFVSAVKIISQMVKGLNFDTLAQIPDILKGYSKLQPGTQFSSVSGSTRLGVYATDFGWGKPVKVEIVSIDNGGGLISLAESRDGNGGVEIGLCPKRHEVEVLASIFAHGLSNL